MTVTTIDRAALRALRIELDTALAAFRDNHPELLLTVGSGVYGGQTGSLKLELALKPTDGTQPKNAAEVRSTAQWKLFAGAYGLKAEWLGKTFTYAGTMYVITGLNPNARKNPVLIRNAVTNKMMVAPVDLVVNGMAKVAA